MLFQKEITKRERKINYGIRSRVPEMNVQTGMAPLTCHSRHAPALLLAETVLSLSNQVPRCRKHTWLCDGVQLSVALRPRQHETLA